MPADSKQYAAFISYRHVQPDRAWAAWLHRALESYRVPKALVAKGYPRRLGRVFRDEEELAAAHDLSAEVTRALEASRHLVVVCSPQTPSSRWVNAEVRRFHDLGRSERVLALLIAGEPRESFPEALRAIRPGADTHHTLSEREAEPLAADVRPIDGETNRGRRRTALLRTAAAILGSSYDDLRRREEMRSAKRRRVAGAVALASILVLTSLVVWALRERSRANDAATLADNRRIEAEEARTYEADARADAEGLVEFMLTDLREQLEKLGKLEVLRGVTERSLSYYTGLPERHESLASARRKASGMDTLGRVFSSLGEIRQSISVHKQSLDIIESVAAAQPDNLRWQEDLLIARLNYGRLAVVDDRPEDGLKLYRSAMELGKRLLEQDQENPDLLRHVGFVHFRIGDLHRRLKAYDDALASFRESLALRTRIAERRPSDARALDDVSDAHGDVGATLLLLDKHTEAATALRGAIDWARRAERLEPENPAWKASTASHQRHLAWALQATDDSTGAKKAAIAAIESMTALVSADPANINWRTTLSTAHVELARILLAQEDFEGAERAYEHSLKESLVVARQSPTTDNRRMVAISHFGRARLAEARGDLQAAVDALRAASEVTQELAAQAPRFQSEHEMVTRKLEKLEAALASKK